MDSVIIASKNKNEAHLLKEIINKEFNVTLISSFEDLNGNIDGTKLIILDQNFMEKSALDFLSNTVKNLTVPIIYLSAPDDIELTQQAFKRGAYHVVHKVPNFYNFMNLCTRNAVTEFNEKQKLYRGIKILRQKVDDLEKAEKEDSEKKQCESSSVEIKEGSILDKIVFVFKRGEIDLPTPPQIGIRFRKLLDQGANLQKIGDLLSKDMAISSKLISISNTAFYRGMAENKNLPQAISRLGIDTTKQYVEAILNRSLYITKNKNFTSYIESLWEHSLSCAYATQILAETLNLKLTEDAFTLGLLHDIGKLVLYRAIAELQLKKKLGDNIDSSEVLDTVDKNHEKFGASLLKLWKFSKEYVRVAAYHSSIDTADLISKELLIVNFANQLVNTIGYGQKEHINVDLCSLESATLLKLDKNMIDSVKEKLKLLMEEIGRYLS
jgi:putative nucleotidyltransferase with HDIG domain